MDSHSNSWRQSLRLTWGNGVVIISLAAFHLSLGTLCVKFLTSQNSLDPFLVAFIPSSVSWLICSVVCCTSGQWRNLTGGSYTVLSFTLLRAVLGAAALSLYYFSIEFLQLKDAVTLFFCSPVMAALMEWAIQKETLSSSVLIGGTFTVLGIFFITQPGCLHQLGQDGFQAGLPPEKSAGMLLAVLAATCNAGAFVAIRMLRDAQSTLSLTWWYHLVVASTTSIPLLLGQHAPSRHLPSASQASLLAVVTATQLVGQMLLNRGFKLMSATRGSAINVMQVVWSYVWELLILRERLNLVSAMGGFCVTAGVLVVASSAPPHISRHDANATVYSISRSTSSEEPGHQKYRILPSADTGLDVPGDSSSSHRSRSIEESRASPEPPSPGTSPGCPAQPPPQELNQQHRHQLGKEHAKGSEQWKSG